MSECDSGMRVTFYCHQHGSEWRSGHDRCLLARAEAAEAEVERLTAELAESEAARTLAEGHSATLSKQLDRANMLRIRALNGLREQTKVTIDQGVALAERDRSIADLSALRHDSGEYPWHCAVCEAVHRLALRGES